MKHPSHFCSHCGSVEMLESNRVFLFRNLDFLSCKKLRISVNVLANRKRDRGVRPLVRWEFYSCSFFTQDDCITLTYRLCSSRADISSSTFYIKCTKVKTGPLDGDSPLLFKAKQQVIIADSIGALQQSLRFFKQNNITKLYCTITLYKSTMHQFTLYKFCTE